MKQMILKVVKKLLNKKCQKTMLVNNKNKMLVFDGEVLGETNDINSIILDENAIYILYNQEDYRIKFVIRRNNNFFKITFKLISNNFDKIKKSEDCQISNLSDEKYKIMEDILAGL